jgi:aspartyl-tRNA(Asn)/glutamyl-tRNA(Gln) amidotransferase subunit C
MKISSETVRHVAQLARLDVPEDQLEAFAGQIADILDYVDTLNEVNTAGVRPTSHAISLFNAFREDAPTPHLPMEKALENAPDGEDGSFIVPKVIG